MIEVTSDFMQNMICTYIVPSAIPFIYYIIVGILYGNLFSPKELFNLIKLKLLNIRLKKYMMINSIPLEYLNNDIKNKISECNSDIGNLERQIDILKEHISNVNKKLNS